MIKKQEMTEVVEYWNKKEGTYEVMLTAEWEKKKMGWPYSVILKDNKAPFVVFGEELENADWMAIKKNIPAHQIEVDIKGKEIKK